ncbi:uncharacterized protein LOC128633498 [Ictalurus punctatus]|uniref:Uncharacterized protein LOC128633498 n=1 Tax=Ictalurus punctatus TaxID=7998 RepID=A0A9F7TM21_ICTPU|nr:uncharacterized protein LOC128633498 [Ictalurus punctatus]
MARLNAPTQLITAGPEVRLHYTVCTTTSQLQCVLALAWKKKDTRSLCDWLALLSRRSSDWDALRGVPLRKSPQTTAPADRHRHRHRTETEISCAFSYPGDGQIIVISAKTGAPVVLHVSRDFCVPGIREKTMDEKSWGGNTPPGCDSYSAACLRGLSSQHPRCKPPAKHPVSCSPHSGLGYLPLVRSAVVLQRLSRVQLHSVVPAAAPSARAGDLRTSFHHIPQARVVMGEGSVPFSWSTVIGLNESEALWHAVHPSGGEENQKQTL